MYINHKDKDDYQPLYLRYIVVNKCVSGYNGVKQLLEQSIALFLRRVSFFRLETLKKKQLRY